MGRKMNGKATTPTAEQTLTPLRKNGKIWSHIRKQWLDETPEESVRQEYLKVLVEEYGFSLDQIEEEVSVTGRGSGDARADFLIWRTPEDKRDNKHAFIVVECKSDNVTIDREVYRQGMNYAQYEQARFFVTHNNRETKYWKVDLARRAPNFDEIENIPHADASDKEMDDLISKLKVFKEDEFADLLHQCHNVIRNREKKDPAAAFDEIAKILFVKVYVERELRSKRRRKNIFTAEFLEEQIGDDPLNDLFEKTKRFYKDDQIFDDEVINLKPATGKEIVRMLERYNLSETSEDIKGIAFERFLGRTFRGEIGQFFTPRTIVEFMIRMVDPKEGEVICDPASGSGGFLIRFFEMVRQQILADADRQYQEYKASLEGKKLSEAKRAELLRAKYAEIQATIDQSNEESRLWKLANRYIFGTDANDRMARTSKMNMIMHGDGHGGVHHHDGFINVNGIFDGRFDIVLTNPPFGANVESGDVVLESEIEVPKSVYRQCEAEYGSLYTAAYERVRALKDKPIASLFELPKQGQSKVKTEILFIERCLNLLHPGGRMGIVLPEGVFNNPSLAYVREFCEDHAYIRAIVSLPEETFNSAGTTVKASLLFMQKFTEAEQANYNVRREQTRTEIDTKYAPEVETETQRLIAEITSAKADAEGARRTRDKETNARARAHLREAEAEARERSKAARKQLGEYLTAMEERKRVESRALLKEQFDYLIFMCEAEKVGITSTGEAGINELYPNDDQPLDVKTTVEMFNQFKRDPVAIPNWVERRLSSPDFPKSFQVKFKDLFRWDPDSFCTIDWHWPKSVMRPISSLLKSRKEKVDRKQLVFSQLQPITIHFDGSVDKRKVDSGKEYTMELYHARPGDLVVAKIDLKNGAVGIVPMDWNNVVVTSHFAVYEIDTSQVRPEYLHRVIQQKDFKEYLWRHKVGAEGRKEVKLDFFESIEIPVPDLATQDTILSRKRNLLKELERLKGLLASVDTDMEQMILGARQGTDAIIA